MNRNNISRKDFLRNSALAGIGALAGTQAVKGSTLLEQKTTNMQVKDDYILKNVRLETGFEYDNDEIIGTRSELFNLHIKDGKINFLNNADSHTNAIDMKGWLMLPAFSDMHIHLDKTFYGSKWQATRRRSGGVKGMIALEQEILPDMLHTSTERAIKLIELLQGYGSSFARSHVNIEPTSKLDSLKNLEKALSIKKDGFSAELVAFPQHGIFYTDSASWLKETAQMDIDFIGGVDPYSLDGNIERSIDFMVQLALDYNKGIDLHLHESGDSGLKTVQYLIEKVNENPILKGKTDISHSFVLGRLEGSTLQKTAEDLAAAEIGIMSTVPFGSLIMPIPTLQQYGVKVFAGNDSIIDHWNTFGSGSVLQKANVMAQLYGYSSEQKLSRCLGIATQGVTPLSDTGEMVWPKQNDYANVTFVDASCSAEAVSRISPVKSLVHQGNLVFKNE